jgi:hypothetical protein
MYSQRDPRWGSEQLGYSRKNTIGTAGCLLTCFAQLAANHGIGTDPGLLNGKLKAKGLFSGGDLPDNALAKAYPDILYIGSINQYKGNPLELGLFDRKPGEEVIIKIDFNHNLSDGVQGHFVLLKNWTYDGVIIADPWYGSADDFIRHYGKPEENIIRVIKYKFKEV